MVIKVNFTPSGSKPFRILKIQAAFIAILAMADVQKYFKEFHDYIKLDYESNSILRQKRDIVLRDLQSGLRRMFGAEAPQFTWFNQGSYVLKTGVYPLDSDFDIDVGIVFKLNRNDFSPTRVKSWIYEALATKNRTVYFKRPCVSVQYHYAGEESYHVDLAIYTEEESRFFKQQTFYLAKGYPSSKNDYKLWELAEPFELLDLIKSKFEDTDDRAQFRRVIRYLKRWNDLNFYSDGNYKPRGIAVTALAFNLFRVCKTYDSDWEKYRYNDLKALRNFVSSVLDSFDWFGGISVELPVEPGNNLFDKMTANQMEDFKNRLLSFKDTLDYAVEERNVEEACYALWEEFDDDFPTPGYE